MKLLALLMALCLLLGGTGAHADAGMAFSRAVVGGEMLHTVQTGDTLVRLGARHGVAPALLAADNQLERKAALRVGAVLRVDNAHIVPAWRDEGIVINIPQRMLFLFRQGALVAAFPVGLGKPDWPTPLGEFVVANRQQDKDWIVPPAIQEEMRLAGKAVAQRVPPGPENPLGRHWLGLDAPGYGIHGTPALGSIYGFPSHGCIRAHPDDIAALFRATRVGMQVALVYHALLLAETPDGRIFLEAHRDIYRRDADPLHELQRLANVPDYAGRIDWPRAFEVVRRQAGVAVDVTLPLVADF